MRSSWLPRLVAAAAAAGVVAFAAPAWAADSISINSGNVPTTAAGFAGHECSANQGGGPYAGQDVWVFNLPGSSGAGENFTSVTGTWTTPDGPVTKTIPTDGGAIVHIGTSKAYLSTPAGWTLTGATATVTGNFTFFVLTHTCPASTGTPSPSTSTSSSPSASTSATPSPETSVSSTPGGTPSVSPSPTGGLPVTGTAIGAVVATGAALLVLGGGLVFAYRRRSLVDAGH